MADALDQVKAQLDLLMGQLTRRQAVGAAAMAVAPRGDGLRRPVNAPAAGQVATGVQPGVTSGVVIARIVIIYGTGNIGLFEYNGNPGPGNAPIAYIAPPGVTADPYGNSLPVTSGGFVSAESGLLAALTQGEAVLSYQAGTGYAGQPALAQPSGMRVEVPSAASDSPALLIAGPSADSSALQSIPIMVLYGKSADGTSPPSIYTGTDDGSAITWTLSNVTLTTGVGPTQAASYGTDWEASGDDVNGIYFQLGPDGWVDVAIDVKTSGASPGITMCPIPSAFQPATVTVCGFVTGSGGAGNVYPVNTASSGADLNVSGIPAASGDRYVGTARYRLAAY